MFKKQSEGRVIDVFDPKNEIVKKAGKNPEKKTKKEYEDELAKRDDSKKKE